MKIYNSYSEASNEARRIAMETKQTVKVIRELTGWSVASNPQDTVTDRGRSNKGVDIEEAFSRVKGDHEIDYDADPPF